MKPGSDSPHPAEIEGSHEEGPEFRIVAKPVFRQHQRMAGAFGDWPGDDRNVSHHMPPCLSRKAAISRAISGPESLPQEVAAVVTMFGPSGVRQQTLEAFGEGRGVEHIVLASPDDQRVAAQSGFRSSSASSQGEAGLGASACHPGESSAATPMSEGSGLGIGQDGLVSGSCASRRNLSRPDDGQIHPAPCQDIVTAQQIGLRPAVRCIMRHGEQARVEFGRRRRPMPRCS